MGTASSRRLDYHKPTSVTATRSRRRLSERKAWRIAMAWRDQLRGCVRLETETETDRLAASIIPIFEWVTFVFNGSKDHESGFAHVKDLPETVAYARAATIVWFALSCCPGYSGTENPRFWKRVFFEFLYPKELPSLDKRHWSTRRPQLPMTESVRFFTEAERPFPRIRLVVGKADEKTTTAEWIFLGRDRHPNGSRDRQLQQTLIELQPFIRAPHWKRCVPVQVDMLSSPFEKTIALLEEAARIAGNDEAEPEPAAHQSSIDVLPRFRLRSVKLESISFDYLERLDSVTPVEGVDVIIKQGLRHMVNDHRLSRGFLRCLNSSTPPRQSDPQWLVASLTMYQTHDFSVSHLAVACSALPHLKCITTVDLPPCRQRMKEIPPSIALDWAWLGYAIFHPDAAAQSGLNTLEFELLLVSPTDIAAFRSMAMGNNLLGGDVSGYLEGRVLQSTDVLSRPQDDDGEVLHTFVSETWVSLCVPAVDALEYQEWICVVIPGYGSGWLRRADIIDVRCRPPGKPFIRTLRMLSTTISEEVLTGLLTVLGSGVTTLALQSDVAVPSGTIQVMLRLCPSLKTLRIRHSGYFWADEWLAMDQPRLEELELAIHYWKGELLHLQELKPVCLPHLKALRVIAYNQDCFKKYKHILVSFLGEQPVLQYLHWSSQRFMRPRYVDTPNFRKNKATRQFLRQLPVEHQLCEGPVRLDCRLAFLSVIGSTAGRSYVSQLGEDVVKLIFQYATSPTPREIAIYP